MDTPLLPAKATKPVAALYGYLVMRARYGKNATLENLDVTNPSDGHEKAKEFQE